MIINKGWTSGGDELLKGSEKKHEYSIWTFIYTNYPRTVYAGTPKNHIKLPTILINLDCDLPQTIVILTLKSKSKTRVQTLFEYVAFRLTELAARVIFEVRPQIQHGLMFNQTTNSKPMTHTNLRLTPKECGYSNKLYILPGKTVFIKSISKYVVLNVFLVKRGNGFTCVD